MSRRQIAVSAAMVFAGSLVTIGAVSALSRTSRSTEQKVRTQGSEHGLQLSSNDGMQVAKGNTRTATFAGGCFWCIEAAFQDVPGVLEAIAGYTGGQEQDARYPQVSTGNTAHREAVKVFYDPARVSYQSLLDVFWSHIDPTDAGGQFADRGEQYRSAIYYHDPTQRRLAQQSMQKLQASGRFDKPIVVDILPAKPFYAAETYHQDYFEKQPQKYKRYFKGSGRADYIERTGTVNTANTASCSGDSSMKPSKEELRRRLEAMEYRVTQENGTEPAFANRYWNHKEDGIYVDVVSGEPLFSSRDKFDSGTGWPSFTKPLEASNVVEHEDRNLGMKRVEVRSSKGDSHLGHVFDDGPGESGLRYCMNSAALRFIAKDQLEAEGYGQYLSLFDDAATKH